MYFRLFPSSTAHHMVSVCQQAMCVCVCVCVCVCMCVCESRQNSMSLKGKCQNTKSIWLLVTHSTHSRKDYKVIWQMSEHIEVSTVICHIWSDIVFLCIETSCNMTIHITNNNHYSNDGSCSSVIQHSHDSDCSDWNLPSFLLVSDGTITWTCAYSLPFCSHPSSFTIARTLCTYILAARGNYCHAQLLTTPFITFAGRPATVSARSLNCSALGKFGSEFGWWLTVITHTAFYSST